MIRKILLAGTALCVFSNPAFADDRDDRIRILEQQVQMLMSEVQNLKQEQKLDRQTVSTVQQDVVNTKKVVEAIKPNTNNIDNVKITMNPTPKIESGEFSWQPTGRIHVDAAAFNDDKTDHPDGAEVRRARLGMKGKIKNDLDYKLEIDFANEGVAFRDTYLAYNGIENTKLRIGNVKPPLGLEELTSSNNITLIERSSPTAAFVTGHVLGIDAKVHGENWSVTGGIFNDDVGRQSNDDEALSIAARATFTPVLNDGKLIHLGAAAAYRKPDQANNSFDFDSRAENALQSSDSVSANFANADNAQIYGLEAAAAWNSVSIQGEYFIANVARNNQLKDLNFNGGYVQSSWILTGENRGYKAGSGTFGGVKPANSFDPKNNHWGAVELAARYSFLDTSDEDILGGEMNNVTLGANWYLNKNARLMANYIFVDTDDNAVTPDDDPQLFLIRSQVNF